MRKQKVKRERNIPQTKDRYSKKENKPRPPKILTQQECLDIFNGIETASEFRVFIDYFQELFDFVPIAGNMRGALHDMWAIPSTVFNNARVEYSTDLTQKDAPGSKEILLRLYYLFQYWNTLTELLDIKCGRRSLLVARKESGNKFYGTNDLLQRISFFRQFVVVEGIEKYLDKDHMDAWRKKVADGKLF